MSRAPDQTAVAQLPGLPADAFRKVDTSPDEAFYVQPRFVTHIDQGAITAVTSIYREMLPAGGDILDLMSSWVSHLPREVTYGSVTAHGMNAAELKANPRLTGWFVQDLNSNATLPFRDCSYDGAALCVSVQYLERPVDVFREVARLLRPGASFVVSFSNRCFPTKAIAIWQALDGPGQQELVAAYMRRAGLTAVNRRAVVPGDSDPLWAVVGSRPSAEPE